MWHAAEYLADLAADCEDVDLAREWAPVCMDIAKKDSKNTAKIFVSKYMLARLALMQSDVARAKTLLDQARALLSNPIMRTRARETVVAMDVLLHTQTPGARASKAVVARLQRLHMRTRECGVRDFEIGALLSGLGSINRWEEARKLYDAYVVNFRRSRLPLHSALLQASVTITSAGA
jgi:hypothetical protein